MKKLILLFIVCILLAGCAEHTAKKEKVHCYKTHHKDSGDVFIYWYVWSDSGTTYYTTSPTPITSYGTVSWSKTTDPIPKELQELEQEQLVEEMPETEVTETEFSEDTQSDVDSSDGSDSGSDSDSDGGSSDGGGGE